MNTTHIWANLATDNLGQCRHFYASLGFQENSSGEPSTELVSFTFGKGGFVINFFLKAILEKNTHHPILATDQGNEVIFSLSAASREEVLAWRTRVADAGGTICTEPYDIGPGYTFIFADPDGHRFNVLCWPGM